MNYGGGVNKSILMIQLEETEILDRNFKASFSSSSSSLTTLYKESQNIRKFRNIKFVLVVRVCFNQYGTNMIFVS
jgi:hypothetical protein